MKKDKVTVNRLSLSRKWVPHISLVFREMWDSTALRPQFSASTQKKVEIRGIPHLAKHKRDMGHPLSWQGQDRKSF